MAGNSNAGKTIRLLVPMWQGGNDNGEAYAFGAALLAWLAPKSDAPLVEVPVTPYAGSPLPVKDGVAGRTEVLRILRATRSILDAHAPDRVISFGGDCLVSQAPFAYLNERYDGKLGVLWLDAHPDVTTPKHDPNAHAMVLGNLLGEGEAGLAKEVRRPLDPRRVMFAGLDEVHDHEKEVMDRLGIRRATSSDLSAKSDSVLQWIHECAIEHLAIHFDVDVLGLKAFRSQMFNNPDSDGEIYAPEGHMTFPQVTRLIVDIAEAADVVGMSFAEHMPWDDMNLKRMMERFPFMH